MTKCSRKLKNTIKFKFILALIISIIVGNIISFLILLPYIDNKIEEVLTNRYEVIVSELKNAGNYEEKLDSLIDTYEKMGYILTVNENIDE